VVHFVGGALVGATPQQTYASFLETLAELGVCVVAAPCSGLTGLDHWAAADEVAKLWVDAQPALHKELLERGVSPERLPVFGLGHSLGCKLLLLLGCRAEPPAALAHRANVLVSFNNFPAQRSVPLLDGAAKLQAALLQGRGQGGGGGGLGGLDAAAVAQALQGLSGLGGALGAELGGQLDGLGAQMSDAVAQVAGVEAQRGLDRFGRAMQQAAAEVGRATGLGDAAAAAADAAAGAAAAAASGGVDGVVESMPTEFAPSPEETDALVGASYAVERNLVLKMLTDDLDQSYELAMLLRQRYEASAAAGAVGGGKADGGGGGKADGGGGGKADGGGGRLDFRRLPGTHVTPNTPPLRDLDWTLTEQLGLLDNLVLQQTRQLAERIAFEQEALAAVVAGFILDEANRVAKERSPPPPGGTT